MSVHGNSLSRRSWGYAWKRPRVVNFFPPARVAKRSSGLVWSTTKASFKVTL